MADDTVTAFRRPGQVFSLALLASGLSVLGLGALVATERFAVGLLSPAQAITLFVTLGILPVLASWRQAILDGRLPPLRKSSIKHDHITGWGFIAIALAVSVVIALASWAASNKLADRNIHAQWGVYVVFGLAIAFVIAALLPPINIRDNSILHRIGALVRPFGLLLSAIDSILVFAVAGAAGVTQKWLALRYILLFGLLCPCTVLGFQLPAPFGLIPLGWAFVVAIAISRRWSWVEDDRDLYMLNRSFGSHLRVGFDNDLRDEALLSFMFMFFIIPLSLRQGQMWSEQLSQPLFAITLDHAPRFIDWIGFFGAELAKAVPFVDWAEVYRVEGDSHFEAQTAAAQHVMFAMRVLLDLVFLAALVQALSISARNAKQMELFKEGTLNRLDPFTEPREFRKLLRRGEHRRWEVDPAALATFPKYDPIRLAELSDHDYAPINVVAVALRKRDGSDDAAKFSEQLLERAFQKNKNVDAIEEALNAIRMTGQEPDPDELDRVRIELNSRPAFNEVRRNLMRLVVRAPASDERLSALCSALSGISAFSDGKQPYVIRDSISSVRQIALEALKPLAQDGNLDAIRAIRLAEENDQAPSLRSLAREALIGPRSAATT